MLRGPQKSHDTASCNDNGSRNHGDNDDNDDGNDDDTASHIDNHSMSVSGTSIEDPTTEILQQLNQTKQEFNHGTKRSTASVPVAIDVAIGNGDTGAEEIELAFYHSTQILDNHSSNNSLEQAPIANVMEHGGSLPACLSREEGYHENASVAVAAILTPNSSRVDGSTGAGFGTGAAKSPAQKHLHHHEGNELCSMHSGISVHSSRTVNRASAHPASPSAFQSPKSATSNISGGSQHSNDNEKSPTTAPLLSPAAEEKLDKLPSKLLDPSATLSDLLRAIASPSGDPTQVDLAYMVRRKNACGALKVLTSHSHRRKQICWTVGVLPALTSVLRDAKGPANKKTGGKRQTLEQVYPDIRTRMEYEEARRRAIAALTNLAIPVSNRLAVFHTPGLVQALIDIVQTENGGECLEGACAILAYLAKSNENRIIMAQVPGLFEAVLSVLKPSIVVLKPSINSKLSSKHCSKNSPSSKSLEKHWVDSVSRSNGGSSVSSVDEDHDDVGSQDRSLMSRSAHSSEGDLSDEVEHDEEEFDDVDEEYFEEADVTDEEDMSTDGEDSMTGSERSDDSSRSAMSESSGEDDTTSEYCSRSISKRISRKAKAKTNISPSKKPFSAASKHVNLQPSDYDKDKHVSAARKNLFAMLGHLVKEKDNAVSGSLAFMLLLLLFYEFIYAWAHSFIPYPCFLKYHLARVHELVLVVVEISRMIESPIHSLAVQFLAHLTRHRLNSKILVFKEHTVVPALVKATYSNIEASRRYACFAIQNFSHNKSCRQELAGNEKLITALCKRARHSRDTEERLASICALKNLTDEPANLIPLSNTSECIATLMQIAHGQEDGITEMIQFRACDALATISHWLRKIATNGQMMNAAKHGEQAPERMFVPSLDVVGFEQYQ